MNVADILRIKGSTVKTVTSDETALGLSHKLRIEHIGAMIVSNDGKSIDGIISERDLAYGLAAYGSQLPRMAVSKLMTKVVVTCSPEDSITDAMKLMTQRSPPTRQGWRSARGDHQHRRRSQASPRRGGVGSQCATRLRHRGSTLAAELGDVSDSGVCNEQPNELLSSVGQISARGNKPTTRRGAVTSATNPHRTRSGVRHSTPAGDAAI